MAKVAGLLFVLYAVLKVLLLKQAIARSRALWGMSELITNVARVTLVVVTAGSAFDDIRFALGSILRGGEFVIHAMAVIAYILHYLALPVALTLGLDATLGVVNDRPTRVARRNAFVYASVAIVTVLVICGAVASVEVVGNLMLEERFGILVYGRPKDLSLSAVAAIGNASPIIFGVYSVLAGLCVSWRLQWAPLFVAQLVVFIGMGLGGAVPIINTLFANFLEALSMGSFFYADLKLRGSIPPHRGDHIIAASDDATVAYAEF